MVFEAASRTITISPACSMPATAAICCRPTTLGSTTLPPRAVVEVGSAVGWQPGEVGRPDAGLLLWFAAGAAGGA
jgi:hypothetical protein